jgi:hypothetical protein
VSLRFHCYLILALHSIIYYVGPDTPGIYIFLMFYINLTIFYYILKLKLLYVVVWHLTQIIFLMQAIHFLRPKLKILLLQYYECNRISSQRSNQMVAAVWTVAAWVAVA